jgi:hypothetical protein
MLMERAQEKAWVLRLLQHFFASHTLHGGEEGADIAPTPLDTFALVEEGGFRERCHYGPRRGRRTTASASVSMQ